MNLPATVTDIDSDLHRRVMAASQQVQGDLLDQMSDGHWTGELSASALSTATAISTLSFQLANTESTIDDRMRLQVNAGIDWLSRHQNADGGWGDTVQSHSNISTTMLVIAALHAANRATEFAGSIKSAWAYVESQGGIPGLRARYGKDKTFAVPILANCAMAGIVDWKEVGVFPFELACIPQKFYHLVRMPVVSYAIPALVAIGQAKFHFDPPSNPVLKLIRRRSIQRSLNVLQRMQPGSGGYLEAVPLTSFVTMSLIKIGRSSHPVAKSGIRFLLESFREHDGSWPIDTNLATWVTTLAINALAIPSNQALVDRVADQVDLQWLLDCQYQSVHPFTGASPGGWGWSDLSGAVPDADDTPGALLALRALQGSRHINQQQRNEIRKSAAAGVAWLLRLQNRDDGWPTFCRGWGKFPFDRSGADITAHCLRAISAWRSVGDSKRMDRAIRRGMNYLRRCQNADGSWFPLWFGNQDAPDEENPIYGTVKVLRCFIELDAKNSSEALAGLQWLKGNQNSDGGWGGGASNDWKVAELGSSSVEETALAVEILADYADNESVRTCFERGLQWLTYAVENGHYCKPSPIGFYFAKLWYYEKLYPMIFAGAALTVATCRLGDLQRSSE